MEKRGKSAKSAFGGEMLSSGAKCHCYVSKKRGGGKVCTFIYRRRRGELEEEEEKQKAKKKQSGGGGRRYVMIGTGIDRTGIDRDQLQRTGGFDRQEEQMIGIDGNQKNGTDHRNRKSRK